MSAAMYATPDGFEPIPPRHNGLGVSIWTERLAEARRAPAGRAAYWSYGTRASANSGTTTAKKWAALAPGGVAAYQITSRSISDDEFRVYVRHIPPAVRAVAS